MRSSKRWLLLSIVVGLTACATIPEDAAKLGSDRGPVEIADTPFYAQEQYQCGPAALTTVLVHSGIVTSVDNIVAQVYVPGRQGSLQQELLAATRAAGRIPYVIDQSLSAIYAELSTDRPVLVLQNLGVKRIPQWHYAVVVGIDPGLNEVYLRSGTERRRTTRLTTFLRTWQRGEFWAFVALRPGELPTLADAKRFAEAVSAFELSGHNSAASASWNAAAALWPENPVVLFGLANAEFSGANFVQAEALYRRVLLVRPDNRMAGNNLALALAHQGQQDAALAQIDSVIRQADPNDHLKSEYVATRIEIRQMFSNARSH